MADQTHRPTLDEVREGLSLATDQSHDVVVPRLKIKLTSVTPQFAPGPAIYADGDLTKESAGEVCKVAFEVVDPWAQLSAVRLEVARKAAPAEVLARVELAPAMKAPGRHEVKWDGLGTAGAAAGMYIHVVHSPYVVRVVGTEPAGEVRSEELETAVVLDRLLLVRGPAITTATPPAAKSDGDYQLKLLALGFHPGPIDGSIGDKSKRAIKNFQRAHAGLRATGSLDAYTRAYLDGEAPAGGTGRYQFILSALGFGCGAIDGLIGKATKRAVRAYRAARGLPPGDALDAAVKAGLDGEALPQLTRREVLEGDLAVGAIDDNPLPAAGAEKKIFIDADSSFCPKGLPYHQKFAAEAKNLARPHFPVVVRPLIKKTDGSAVFAPAAVGPLEVEFAVDTAPPPGDLGIPAAAARAYVQAVMSKDGGEATTGHHAHVERGGVRGAAEPAVFLDKKRYAPYDVRIDGAKYVCACPRAEADGPARGAAGVYFVPSTIAGDRFTLVAAVRTAGFDTPPAGDFAEKTGTMIVWRRYRIAKLWLMQYAGRPHRTETQPQLGLESWYTPAFIKFEEPAAPREQVVQPRGADEREVDLALYTAILREAGYAAAQLPDAQIQARFAGRILWPLNPAAAYDPADEQGYYDAIDSEITAFEERFGGTLRGLSDTEAPEGLVILVFHDNAPRAGNLGIHAITDPNLQSWGWSLLANERVVHLIDDQDLNGTAIDGETLAHEVGHALWLHHATTSAGNSPAASDQPEHNQPEWETCTMSYVTLPNFCGHCVLKLRGWNEEKLA